MDKDKKQKSELGNDKNLKNAEKNDVTGVKTSDLRKDNDAEVKGNQGNPAGPNKAKTASSKP
jgi:hypothetical protein